MWLREEKRSENGRTPTYLHEQRDEAVQKASRNWGHPLLVALFIEILCSIVIVQRDRSSARPGRLLGPKSFVLSRRTVFSRFHSWGHVFTEHTEKASHASLKAIKLHDQSQATATCNLQPERSSWPPIFVCFTSGRPSLPMTSPSAQSQRESTAVGTIAPGWIDTWGIRIRIHDRNF